MNRRESLKALLISSVAGGLIINGCSPESENPEVIVSPPKSDTGYGRTKEEKIRDLKLMEQQFFSEHELATIAVLCDIILPATDNYGSAGEAGVPEFIEFIVKDLPYHQLPLRGGIMWLDHQANKRHNKPFLNCTNEQQLALIDEIAYPKKVKPGMEQGEEFFSRMRNLTLTGYYTTKMGIDELGYIGNTANVWDGVPEEVLKKHGLAYDKEWLAKCIDQEKRTEIAKWDDNGNLI